MGSVKTVSSVSGGKSSSYMALHFPTDYYLFAVVLTDQKEAAPKDRGLLRECQKRIPGFVASREVDLTLSNMLKLEQELGKEIKWVTALDGQSSPSMVKDFAKEHAQVFTYDDLIRFKGSLPNVRQRFCTEQLKVYAIFWYVYLYLMDNEQDLVQMNIGIRRDEPARVTKMYNRCDKVKFPFRCPVGAGNKRSKHRWKTVDWRFLRFPLYEAEVDHLDVIKYFVDRNWEYPKISNCDGCFWHSTKKLQTQAELYPERILPWWGKWEDEIGFTWKKEMSYKEVLNRQNPVEEEVLNQGGCFCSD